MTTDVFRNDPNLDSFDRGTTIFRRGDDGTTMYVVVEGAVDLQIGDRLLERVEAGGIFGEMALIEHKPRTATATAAEPSRVARIDRKRFLYALRTHRSSRCRSWRSWPRGCAGWTTRTFQLSAASASRTRSNSR